MLPFARMLDQCKKDGWAVGTLSFSLVRWEADRLGYQEVPIRRGGPPISTLKPHDAREAHAPSLSAVYGKGDQPLHTDGAHLANPPDLIALHCGGVNEIPTKVLPLIGDLSPGYSARIHMTHGIFLVQNGHDSFFAPAYEGNRYRYDPGCMTPCDSRSRRTVDYFAGLAERAIEISWDEPEKFLLLDNRRVLHGRPAATEDPNRELQRVCLSLKRGAA
ncbi:hypothetical protein GCM10023205_61690 [Yinghuangia aomiensis]|uniref:Taurine catabolism dioxygenase TauD, TfdA family n=1 Tax=Yinghuangia aomiensis TaxID=676205 RepID=A0ABP9I0F6_9ACTN